MRILVPCFLAFFSPTALAQEPPSPPAEPDVSVAPQEPTGEDEAKPDPVWWCTDGLKTDAGKCIVGFQMVEVPGGVFTAGSQVGPMGNFSLAQRRTAVLSQSVWMNHTEVTQGQFEALMGFNPSSTCAGTLDPVRPVSCVSWNDALAFANTLSATMGLTPAYRLDNGRWVWDRTADGYRLPTSLEWERAARGQRQTLYAGADNAETVSWFRDNASGGTQPVATRMGNDLGLYDMSGNVWEWVWDGAPRGLRPTRAKVERTDYATVRLQRGGSYADAAVWLAITGFDSDAAHYLGPTVGFRLARNGSQVPESELPPPVEKGKDKKKDKPKKDKADKEKGKKKDKKSGS